MASPPLPPCAPITSDPFHFAGTRTHEPLGDGLAVNVEGHQTFDRWTPPLTTVVTVAENGDWVPGERRNEDQDAC